MAYNLYVKSFIWLLSFGGIGYALLCVTEPSADKIERIRSTTSRTHLSEEEKKKLMFMKVLKESSTRAPHYLQKKNE